MLAHRKNYEKPMQNWMMQWIDSAKEQKKPMNG